MLEKIKIKLANEKLKKNPKKRFMIISKVISAKNQLFRNPKGRENCFLDKYKAVYIPIPRVANTSFKKMFLQVNSRKKLLSNKMKKIHDSFNFPKLPEKDLLSNKYFKFTFVRNPYDRLVSCYLATIKKSGITNEGFYRGVHRGLLENSKKFNSEMSFDEFAEVVSEIPDDKSNEHFKSQYTFLYRKGKFLPNFVGKLENLEKDLKEIFSTLKIKRVVFPEKLNSSKEKANYRKYYSDKTKKIVKKRYEKDLKLLKYKF